MSRKYISLNNHTTFSIGNGLSKPIDLFSKAKELGQDAIGIADYDTMAGMWDCLKAYKKTGVKLIPGCVFNFTDSVKVTDAKFTNLILLAKNHTGYKNILALRKFGFDNYIIHFKKAFSRIDWSLLEKHSDGIICLSADGNGYIPQLIMEDRYEEAVNAANRFKDIFGDNFVLELQPHNLQRRANAYTGDVDQRKINLALKKISEECNIRCVVTTNSHYINKEDHDAHDLLLSISSGQPVSSGQRLTFDKRDFYVKTADEIYSYFARHKNMWGEAFIDSLFDNTVELANRCENPDWIDPAVATGIKSQLPRFPIEDEPDYEDFLKWKETYSENHLPDDALYYRYKSFKGLDEKIASGELSENDRDLFVKDMLEEFDVFEARGFSSYMLIVSDMINWCRKNDISVGPGRGCLTGNALVLTENGFVNLSNINIGDSVFTHSGNLKIVNDKFTYDIDEDGLEIFTDYSFNPIKLTNDHKLLASVSIETERYTKAKIKGAKYLDKIKRFDYSDKVWVKAADLSTSDRLFMPFPIRNNIKDWDSFDLLDFAENYESYSDDEIIFKEHNQNEYSIRNISKNSGISRNALQSLLKVGVSDKSKRTVNKLKSYFKENNLDFNFFIKNENYTNYSISRFLECNFDFFYFIGRWVGDGWITYTASKCYNVGIAFNSDDLVGIRKINNYLLNLGFKTSVRKTNNGKKLVQIIIRNKLLFKFLEYLFPDYKQKSSTKHLPINFRTLPEDKLIFLLKGLKDSDGNTEVLPSGRGLPRESIDTTSIRLAKELKEALLYLKIPCSINTRKPYKHGKYLCSQSYKIRFKGIDVGKIYNDSGYYCKINKINKVKIKKVYDISVADDRSYLTSNYAVHNSIGGSKSAYVIGLHAANPGKYGLIFARFLNKFKDAFPDIDTDFSPAGRDKLHAYIKQKYGEDHVAHVSNINTITAKVYARDLARAFDLAGDRKESVALGNDIADSITDDAKYVKKALESSPLFAEYAKQYPELERFADSIGGQARAWSTHAAGIVLGVEPLHTIVPIRRDPHGAMCLEYEKERAEENGLIKIDTLGLKTLDIIDNTIRIIKSVGKTPPPEPFDYEVEDKETYDLISRGDTFGVFQLTGVAAPVCRILKPKNIYDIALISSLIRPAAKEIIPEFMKVRNGEKELELIHPSLDRALRPTNGFGLFEESLMFIAADVAGWNFHEADGLRKMTKDKGKHPEKVEALRASFIADAEKNNNINKEIATRIWDEVIAGFGGYGFNSSHAVLYSMISFKTAYLKAHYPLEFLVANLMSEVESNSPMAKDNILKIKDEIRALGVKVLPPDINKSHMSYQIIDDKTLMTGLDALKYMGGDAIPDIMSKRPFSSFKDFMVRIDPSKVRSTTIQALAASGSLDCFGLDRKVMFLYCADFKKKIQALRTSLDKKVQKGKITQEEADAEIAAFEYPFPEEKPWPVHEIYALEEYYLGEGLSGTVPERFPGFFNSKVIDIKKISEMMPFVRHSDDERDNRKANTHNIEHHGIPGIKGVVMNVHEFKVKKEDSPIFGQIMARFTVQDPYGNNLDCVAFPDGWDRAKSRIEKELSGGKSKFDVGIALFFNGAFQWENENTYSFILGDILSYKDSPSLPKDKKAKSVKIPRKTKVSKKEVKEMSSQDLAEALDEEMAFEDIK